MGAGEDEQGTQDDRIRRTATRTLANGGLLVLLLAILAAWAYTGVFELKPGEAAVILVLGKYERTEQSPGFHWHLPVPLASEDIVDVSRIQRAEFGAPSDGEPTAQQLLDGRVQTRDNNIVDINFVVQYRIKDAFDARYRIAEPGQILRDAAQAAIREVIGRTTIDQVLTEQRGEVQAGTRKVLQDLLDEYDSGLRVDSVELKQVEPPMAVRAAFDDVISASQDKTRAINEAQGYANEVLPRAHATAAELKASSEAYRVGKIAEATGQAGRFSALLTEYEKAPVVTSRRLYLETMEEVLAGAEKILVEPGTTSVLPYRMLDPARLGDGPPAMEPSPGPKPSPVSPGGAGR